MPELTPRNNPDISPETATHFLQSGSMSEQQQAMEIIELTLDPKSVEPLLRYIENSTDPDLDHRATNLLSIILNQHGASIPQNLLEQIATLNDGEHPIVERVVTTPTDAGIFKVERDRQQFIGMMRTALRFVTGDTKKQYEERLAAAENYNPDDYTPDQEFTVRPLPPEESEIRTVSHAGLRARAESLLAS